MGKSAQFPLHVWLPDAMEGPTPVSALIHAATMVTAGVYLLHRTAWLFALTPDVLAIVGWIGAFTALLAAVLACVQDDIKRVLAYSTVSQLGYMMTAIGAGFAAAGFLHLLTHGVFKALLFLGAGAVIHAVGSNDICRAWAAWRGAMPQTAIVFLVGTLSLAGHSVLRRASSRRRRSSARSGRAVYRSVRRCWSIAAFLTAFYMFRVVFLAFFGAAGAPLAQRPRHVARPRAHAHDAPADDERCRSGSSPRSSVAVGIVLRRACIAEAEFAAPGWLTPAGRRLAVAGIALAWLTYSAPRHRARTGSPGLRADSSRRARAFLARRPLRSGSTAACSSASPAVVGWVDRYIVDGVLNVLSAWTLDRGRSAAPHADRPRAGLRLRGRASGLCSCFWVAAGSR